MGDDHICDTIEFACISLENSFAPGIILVIVISIIIHALSLGIDYLRTECGHLPRIIVPIVLEEMTIAGILSFMLFIIKYLGSLSDDFATYLDFFHLSLFVTLIMYLLLVVLFTRTRSRYNKAWGMFDTIIQSKSDIELEEYEASLWCFGKMEFNLFRQMRSHFIEYHKLPRDFRYNEYLSTVIDYFFEKFVSVGWKNAVTMLFWLICSKIVHIVTNPTETDDKSVSNNNYLYNSTIFFNALIGAVFLYSWFSVELFIHSVRKSGVSSSLGHLDSIVQYVAPEDKQAKSLRRRIFENFETPNGDREWYKQMFPLFFNCHDYVKRFPFRSPNSFLHLSQIFLLAQGLTITVFAFIIAFNTEYNTTGAIFIYFLPCIWGWIFLPLIIPKYCMMRFSGPLANRTVIHAILTYEDIRS